jgi:hypothetical protein
VLFLKFMETLLKVEFEVLLYRFEIEHIELRQQKSGVKLIDFLVKRFDFLF